MEYFKWNEEKNLMLKRERGISFEEIVIAIERGGVLDVVKHPNEKKYGKQMILFVELNDYAIAVPFVEGKERLFLKTAFPDRRATRKYLGRRGKL